MGMGNVGRGEGDMGRVVWGWERKTWGRGIW